MIGRSEIPRYHFEVEKNLVYAIALWHFKTDLLCQTLNYFYKKWKGLGCAVKQLFDQNRALYR